MTINQAGLDLIKSFEGCKLRAYKDLGGIWTIGYGHTGDDVVSGLTITPEQAGTLLAQDLEKTCLAVTKLLKVDVTANQFSALVAFAYNIGVGSLRSSTLLKLLNSGAPSAVVAAQYSRWNKVNGVPVAGLTRRRAAEAALFLS